MYLLKNCSSPAVAGRTNNIDLIEHCPTRPNSTSTSDNLIHFLSCRHAFFARCNRTKQINILQLLMEVLRMNAPEERTKNLSAEVQRTPRRRRVTGALRKPRSVPLLSTPVFTQASAIAPASGRVALAALRSDRYGTYFFLSALGCGKATTAVR